MLSFLLLRCPTLTFDFCAAGMYHFGVKRKRSPLRSPKYNRESRVLKIQGAGRVEVVRILVCEIQSVSSFFCLARRCRTTRAGSLTSICHERPCPSANARGVCLKLCGKGSGRGCRTDCFFFPAGIGHRNKKPLGAPGIATRSLQQGRY